MLKKAGYATGVVGKWHLGLGPKGGPDWNGEIAPAPNDLGFDSSFIMAATGDRVPTVYVENRRVVGLDPTDPIKVSYSDAVRRLPTGAARPDLLTTRPSHGHDQAIVNGISRIGYMTGGTAALWKDEDMADVFTRRAVSFIDAQRKAPSRRSSSTSRRTIRTCRACRTRGSPARAAWVRAATRSLQLDWSVGEILTALDRLSLAANTLRDRHQRQRAGRRRRLSRRCGDEARTPSSERPVPGRQVQQLRRRHARPVRDPLAGAREARRVRARWSSQIDLLRSLAALTGQPLSTTDAPDSVDLLPAFTGRSRAGRTELVLQGSGLALRVGSWKYIEPSSRPKMNAQTNTELGNDPLPQLYDLAADPGETRNLAGEQPQRSADMAALLEKLRRPTR